MNENANPLYLLKMQYLDPQNISLRQLSKITMIARSRIIKLFSVDPPRVHRATIGELEKIDKFIKNTEEKRAKGRAVSIHAPAQDDATIQAMMTAMSAVSETLDVG